MSENAGTGILQFENLYEFLSLELDRPAADIHEEAAHPDGAESLEAATAAAFKGRGFVPYELAEPVRSPSDGQVLVNLGQDLRQKIGSLLAWQCRASDSPVGPICLAAKPEIMDCYRKIVEARLKPARELALSNQNFILERLMGAVGAKKKNLFGEITDSVLKRAMSSSGGLMVFLQATRDQTAKDIWKRTFQTAYVAMSIADGANELTEEDELREIILRTGSAALLADLAVMLKPALYKNDATRHPVRSVQIASEMGFDGAVQSVIADHHRFLVPLGGEMDHDAEPDQPPVPASTIPFEARILLVAGLFMTILDEPSRRGRDIEAIKGLGFLMAEGKVDRRAVTTLTRLYLSHKFALFVEKATEIATHCPHENTAVPILWNILGERNPQKFICNYRNCAHLGSQVTMVSNAIKVEFDGKTIGKIKKGEYYSCRLLTEELGKLYLEISKLSTK